MKSNEIKRLIKRSRVVRRSFTANLSFFERIVILFTGKIYFKYATFVDDPGDFINVHVVSSIDREYIFKIETAETIETEIGLEFNFN